jgi:hypothetical protein
MSSSPPREMSRRSLFDEEAFLSPHGLRSLWPYSPASFLVELRDLIESPELALPDL